MRTARCRWVACLLSAALPLMIAAPVVAQDAATACGTASDNGGFEEIAVTAQRKSENVLRVPVSVSAATGEQLISSGVDQVSELQFTVPGYM
jgi:iron complex outermembrane recepter protein